MTVVDTLRSVTTATITTVLLELGLRNVWMRGPSPLRPGQLRIAGPAFTLRFIPAREDLSTPTAWAAPISTRTAIEAMPPGCIVVADALRTTDSGIVGDILCARMVARGVAGLITDGAVRDRDGVAATPLPVWCAAAAAPPALASLAFVAWQQPIGCGGVAIFPDDIIVADGDGAVVIPAGLAPEVAARSADKERSETWIMQQVEAGFPLAGLYPMNDATRARYLNETEHSPTG